MVASDTIRTAMGFRREARVMMAGVYHNDRNLQE
jgi:hypothetical protein